LSVLANKSPSTTGTVAMYSDEGSILPPRTICQGVLGAGCHGVAAAVTVAGSMVLARSSSIALREIRAFMASCSRFSGLYALALLEKPAMVVVA